MLFDYDVIVVGGGAGGATFAYACAAQASRSLSSSGARRVHADQPLARREGDAHRQEAVRRPRGRRQRLGQAPLHGRNARRGDEPLWRGPGPAERAGFSAGKVLRQTDSSRDLGLADLLRGPRAALHRGRTALRRRGLRGGGFRPLCKNPPAAIPGDPLPLHPLNQRLIAANRVHGLHPFRLPLAIDSSRCLRCGVCAGYICPTGAAQLRGPVARASHRRRPSPQDPERKSKWSAWSRNVARGATLISVLDRATGRRSSYRARRYALGAGAIGSSLLLLRSGLGRSADRQELHDAPVLPSSSASIRKTSSAETSFIKQVGFADFYFGTKKYPHKMGIVQSLPVPGPLMTAKLSPFLPAPVRQFLRQRILPLAGIIEDLPNPANRVTLGPNGEAKLTHRFAKYDIARRKRLTPHIAEILKRVGRGVLRRRASSSPTSTWPINAAPSASATTRPTPSSTRIAACTRIPTSSPWTAASCRHRWGSAPA